MFGKKKKKDTEKAPESEVEKSEEEKEAPKAENDATGKSKDKSIYGDSDNQTMYDELRADGKTDTQVRQIVMLKSR